MKFHGLKLHGASLFRSHGLKLHAVSQKNKSNKHYFTSLTFSVIMYRQKMIPSNDTGQMIPSPQKHFFCVFIYNCINKGEGRGFKSVTVETIRIQKLIKV
jgi:hypothetical protein